MAGISAACIRAGGLGVALLHNHTDTTDTSTNPAACRTPAQLLAKEREVEMGKEDLANKPEAIRWDG